MAPQDHKEQEPEQVHDVIIIGSGPAAHTAAIYAGRANMCPILFEGWMAGGIAAGGQLTTTTEVENFPGFPEGIMGPELMDRCRAQSIRCGADIRTENVNGVHLGAHPFRVMADSGEYRAKSLIIATGATAKKLEIRGVGSGSGAAANPNGLTVDYWQKGVSACAVCDGALPMFRSKTLFVVGGGDSAMEEANYLTKFASKVFIVHRRDELRASKIMQERARANPKIEFLYSHAIEEVRGDGKTVGSVLLKNLKTGECRTAEAGGLFFAIGHEPNTAFLKSQLATDASGYIVTEPGSTRTSVEGVFAAGDVQDKRYRQAITAAGTGCMAALDCERYLADLEDREKQGLTTTAQ